MKNIYSCDQYDIDIDVGCSTACDLPEGTRVCKCFQHWNQKTPQQKQEQLKRRGVRSCNRYPTDILISLKGNVLASETWRNKHRDVIAPKIRRALDEMKIGKGHEIHYSQEDRVYRDNKIGIQLLRNFNNIRDSESGNTTPEK